MTTTPAPDLLVVGARARLAPGRYAAAIAVTGDRITAVGDDADVLALRGSRTRVVQARGATVLPGFQDAHVHAPFAGRNLLRVWLNDLPGRPAYLDAVARFAANHPNEPWVVGGGWAMEDFPNGLARKEDLDAIVPDRPVFLFNRDVHSAWVNSAALLAGGITRDTVDPSDGRIERDPQTGEPTGMLHEGAAYTFNERVVPPPSRLEWEEAILTAQERLHALGITGWQDAWVTPSTLAAYRSLAADGRLTARVVGALWWDRHRGLDQIADLCSQREATTGNHADSGVPGFHPTSVKIMVDGVLETYTGALLEPYCDGCGGHTDNRGLLYVDPELLAEAVTALDAAGFQVHQHAIGDRAARTALDAIAAARTANGRNDRRHHIAHLQVLQRSDIPRFSALGVTANAQAYWAKNDPQMEVLTTPFLGPDRTALQYPFASLAAAGTRLAMGSDWAVTTADPLAQIEVATTRSDPADRELAAFLPHERLTLDAALDAFTAGSAWVNHDDDGGAIRVGARADLAVLDADLFGTDLRIGTRAPIGGGPPHSLQGVSDASVVMTVAAGRVVYEA